MKGRKDLSFNPARVKFAVATMESVTAAGGEQARVAAAAALAGKKPAAGKKQVGEGPPTTGKKQRLF